MFIESRGNDGICKTKVKFSEAILNPSASFGGLYVPENLPQIDNNFLLKSKKLDYKSLCLEILHLFNVDINDDCIKSALQTYDNFDSQNTPAPLVKIKENLFVNELYHGPTKAFKDMALQPFGQIFSSLAKKRNENYLILAATSGDTGPATLETFKNKENIKVVCIYPDGGTSDVQRLQMTTNDGKNIKVLGIKGNFDDAQQTLKSLLNSNEFKTKLKEKNIFLSAANSVNFGRIIFQIIYHINAYVSLLKQGEITSNDYINITVPSGNFGNALGAYYAKKMGLKINKIYISSNINNILTEFFTTGIYDLRNKKLILSTSPAMDILISSNVERLLFDKFGAKRTFELMKSLNENKYYELSKDELKLLREDFDAVFCDDEFAKQQIKQSAKEGYILDPHTATCFKSLEIAKLDKPLVFCSTAHWTKFAPTMWSSWDEDNIKYDDLTALKSFSQALKTNIPKSISSLFNSKIMHSSVVEKNKVLEEILNFLEQK